MKSPMLDRELKKGSAELLILSLVADQPRHGYDLCKLIEVRSGGLLSFRVASLYPLLYRLEKRGWIHKEPQVAAVLNAPGRRAGDPRQTVTSEVVVVAADDSTSGQRADR